MINNHHHTSSWEDNSEDRPLDSQCARTTQTPQSNIIRPIKMHPRKQKNKNRAPKLVYTQVSCICVRKGERVKTQRRPREPAVSVVKSCHAKVVNKVGILDSTIGRSKESVVENEGLTGVNAWT